MERYFQICPKCGGYAFEYKEKPIPNMILSLKKVIHKKNPEPYEQIKCQECDAPLSDYHLTPRFLHVDKSPLL